jgi:hypothetical protein
VDWKNDDAVKTASFRHRDLHFGVLTPADARLTADPRLASPPRFTVLLSGITAFELVDPQRGIEFQGAF